MRAFKPSFDFSAHLFAICSRLYNWVPSAVAHRIGFTACKTPLHVLPASAYQDQASCSSYGSITHSTSCSLLRSVLPKPCSLCYSSHQLQPPSLALSFPDPWFACQSSASPRLPSFFPGAYWEIEFKLPVQSISVGFFLTKVLHPFKEKNDVLMNCT